MQPTTNSYEQDHERISLFWKLMEIAKNSDIKTRFTTEYTRTIDSFTNVRVPLAITLPEDLLDNIVIKLISNYGGTFSVRQLTSTQYTISTISNGIEIVLTPITTTYTTTISGLLNDGRIYLPHRPLFVDNQELGTFVVRLDGEVISSDEYTLEYQDFVDDGTIVVAADPTSIMSSGVLVSTYDFVSGGNVWVTTDNEVYATGGFFDITYGESYGIYDIYGRRYYRFVLSEWLRHQTGTLTVTYNTYDETGYRPGDSVILTVPDINKFSQIMSANVGLSEQYVNLTLAEKELCDEFWRVVVDQFPFDSQDHQRIRRLLIDWYSVNRTLITKSKELVDPYSLESDELDELMRSFGFPYGSYIRTRQEKAAFLMQLVYFLRTKGTPNTFIESLKFFGLNNVTLAEWWIHKKYNGKYVARTKIIYPSEAFRTSNITLEKAYSQFIEMDPFWHLTEPQLAVAYNTNAIKIPSITPIISMYQQFDISQVKASVSIINKKIQETFEFWLKYVLKNIGTIKDTLEIRYSPPENAEVGYKCIVNRDPAYGDFDNLDETDFYTNVFAYPTVENPYKKGMIAEKVDDTTSSEEGWVFTTPSLNDKYIIATTSPMHANHLVNRQLSTVTFSYRYTETHTVSPITDSEGNTVYQYDGYEIVYPADTTNLMAVVLNVYPVYLGGSDRLIMFKNSVEILSAAYTYEFDTRGRTYFTIDLDECPMVENDNFVIQYESRIWATAPLKTNWIALFEDTGTHKIYHPSLGWVDTEVEFTADKLSSDLSGVLNRNLLLNDFSENYTMLEAMLAISYLLNSPTGTTDQYLVQYRGAYAPLDDPDSTSGIRDDIDSDTSTDPLFVSGYLTGHSEYPAIINEYNNLVYDTTNEIHFRHDTFREDLDEDYESNPPSRNYPKTEHADRLEHDLTYFSSLNTTTDANTIVNVLLNSGKYLNLINPEFKRQLDIKSAQDYDTLLENLLRDVEVYVSNQFGMPNIPISFLIQGTNIIRRIKNVVNYFKPYRVRFELIVPILEQKNPLEDGAYIGDVKEEEVHQVFVEKGAWETQYLSLGHADDDMSIEVYDDSEPPVLLTTLNAVG